MLRRVSIALLATLLVAPAAFAGWDDRVQAPRAVEPQAPRAVEIQAPRSDEVQAPRTDLQAPRSLERDEVQAPRG